MIVIHMIMTITVTIRITITTLVKAVSTSQKKRPLVEQILQHLPLSFLHELPSGKRLHNEQRSTLFLMGKLTISMGKLTMF